jgi:homoaconitate hydratase
MSGLTLTEKIVGRHLDGQMASAGARVDGDAGPRQGDFVLVRPRRILTHDNTAAVIPKFKGLFAMPREGEPGCGSEQIGGARIADPSQPVLALDHDIQNHTPENLGRYAVIERFARTHGLAFHRAGSGIGHQLMVEHGHVLPGTLVVASDSHENAYGALGALGVPFVRTDAAVIWATGSTWWQVPRVVRVWLVGELGTGASGGAVGKDVILALCARYPTEVQNAVVEFGGPGLGALSASDRLAIANMSTEWGAIGCVMEPDGAVWAYLESLGVERTGMEMALRADDDARYAGEIVLDLSSVEPTVTGPNRTDRATPASELAARRVRIDAAYLLSCVNARLPDLEQAARVVRGRRVHPEVTFYIAAASASIQREAEARGIWRTLLESGATPLPSGCGPCIGLGEGTLGPGRVAISATNRNFPGRMGDRSAQVYLASPAIVAASAIAGYIMTPEDVQRGVAHRGVGEGGGEEKMQLNTEGHGRKTERSDGRLRSDRARIDAAVSSGRGGLADSRLYATRRDASGSPRAILIPEEDVSTDAIFAGRHTYRSDMSAAEMGAVVFENLDGEGVACVGSRIARGDVILAGRNFGRGSSREQAATALKHRGIAAVVAVSINATYMRNAINNGLLALECPELGEVFERLARERPAQNEGAASSEEGRGRHARIGPALLLDVEGGVLTLYVEPEPITLRLRPLAPFMRALLGAGGVEPWARGMLRQRADGASAALEPVHSHAQAGMP